MVAVTRPHPNNQPALQNLETKMRCQQCQRLIHHDDPIDWVYPPNLSPIPLHAGGCPVPDPITGLIPQRRKEAAT